MNHIDVNISTIDEERFGIKTARAFLSKAEDIPVLLGYCHTNQVIFLITRCSTREIHLAQLMEREGFRLMDALIYYSCSLDKTDFPEDNGRALIRPVRDGEEKDVELVAAAAFHDYFGHYHADQRLDRVKCDKVYASWAFRSCVSKDVANEVLVAELDNRIVGFITLRFNQPDEGEIVLNAVLPDVQKQGIYRSLVLGSARWFLQRNVKRLLISTQLVNFPVQKVISRLGFEPSHSFYTFHKWFDEQ